MDPHPECTRHLAGHHIWLAMQEPWSEEWRATVRRIVALQVRMRAGRRSTPTAYNASTTRAISK